MSASNPKPVEIGYYGCETYLGKAAIRAAKEQADGQPLT